MIEGTDYAISAETLDQPPAVCPIRKRKVAAFVAYIGAGYAGMQHNPGQQTIEAELMKAMSQAGGVSQDNAGHFTKIGWARAARTDKGVSALGQVIALKLLLHDGMLDKINMHLPPQIRMLGISRVTASFDPRKMCDCRHYEYMLPAWALDPSICQPVAAQTGHEANGHGPQQTEAASAAALPVDQPFKALMRAASGPASLQPHTDTAAAVGQLPALSAREPEPEHMHAVPTANHTAADQPAGPQQYTGLQELPEPGQRPRGFSFDEDSIARLNDILAQYVGTHNFHNFTTRTDAQDPAAKRYIRKFCCQGTMQLQGQTWVRLQVVGQSFMLHQIRKMVGLAVALYRNAAADYVLPAALSAANNVHVPMAPEGGLYLERCIFDAYNARWSEQHGAPLDLDQYAEQTAAFKEHKLLPHIAQDTAYHEHLHNFLLSMTEAQYGFSRWQHAPQASTGAQVAGPRRDTVKIRSEPSNDGMVQRSAGKRPAVCPLDLHATQKEAKLTVLQSPSGRTDGSVQAEYSE